MPLCVISVVSPKASARGRLQRLLLEIHPGTFVGRIPTKVSQEMFDGIKGESQSAMLVIASRNESGFVVLTHGDNQRKVVDNFGIPLIAYEKQKRAR